MSGGTLPALELSVVMPCLNEAETLAGCIEAARQALHEHKIVGEIIVADNGSTDGSQRIAARLGACVVEVGEQGYGSALMAGIAAARGRFVIMGDADGSYDFLEIPKFVDKLRAGFDLIQGCRLPSGGGTVLPHAMPFLHRWWGNPMLSRVARWWFRTPIHDVYCGLRGFSKELYERLGQRCTGMEFAVEMIVKSQLYGAHITELPVTLHPDGRTSHAPHLRTFRDGWRTLRFFLMYSPRWLFLVPGAVLVGLGVLGYGLALPGVTFRGISSGCPYPAVCQPGAAVRLSVDTLRRVHQNLCRGGRFTARRSASDSVFFPAHARARVADRSRRLVPRLRTAADGGQPLAGGRLRTPELRPGDAAGDSWRDPDCARISNRAGQLLYQYSGNAAMRHTRRPATLLVTQPAGQNAGQNAGPDADTAWQAPARSSGSSLGRRLCALCYP